MNFGFSVSDFFGLALFVFKISKEIQEGPKECRAFAEELFRSGLILKKVGHLLDKETIKESYHSEIKGCLSSSKDLLYVKIWGLKDTPKHVAKEDRNDLEIDFKYNMYQTSETAPLSLVWRQRWAARNFALRIPKLRQEVAAHMTSLTALSTLVTLSSQADIEYAQDRLETLQGQIKDSLDTCHITVNESRATLTAASNRIEEAQNRIEDQLQRILASQPRRPSPILSHSLDASSPEGRETWMNLGRLLRTEGITPQIIKENRELLIKSMKITLENKGLSSGTSSYHTAFESISARSTNSTISETALLNSGASSRSKVSSKQILGSALPSRATFTDEFLARHRGPEGLLDMRDNIDDGLQTLLAGMGADQDATETDSYDQDDLINFEGSSDLQSQTPAIRLQQPSSLVGQRNDGGGPWPTISM